MNGFWGYVFEKLLEFVPEEHVSSELDFSKIVDVRGQLANDGFMVHALMSDASWFAFGIKEYKGSLFIEADQPIRLDQPHRRGYSSVIVIREEVAQALYWTAVEHLCAE